MVAIAIVSLAVPHKRFDLAVLAIVVLHVQQVCTPTLITIVSLGSPFHSTDVPAPLMLFTMRFPTSKSCSSLAWEVQEKMSMAALTPKVMTKPSKHDLSHVLAICKQA